MTTATLLMRPYAGEADLPQMAEFINACEQADQLDETTSVEELRTELSYPTLDTARDLQLWEDADGRLIGYAEVHFNDKAQDPDAFVWFKVHPDARGELEEQLLAWGAQRAREVERERNVRLRLRAVARAEEPGRMATLERLGFTVDRYFLRMARPLDAPIPEPQLPEGFTVRPMLGEHEVDAWVAMFNESFIDHWNHAPWTAEEMRHMLAEPQYRADLNLIAIAPDGTFAAFAWGGINPEQNVRNGTSDGWIGLLGTRRGFRKIGLGRAMLLAGMRALKAAGVATAKLGVDADSLTGATRLYESAGFQKVYSRMLYGRDM